MTRDLTEEQFHRYARHLILDEVGEEGQFKLLDASVLVVGAGGLGAPLLMYLAAAGVGRLGIVDDDAVELANLQRQIVHKTTAVGVRKVVSAADTLGDINPGVKIERHDVRLDETNAASLIEGWDIVADGSDNFATRYLVNDVCHRLGVPLVSGAILRFEGQLFAIDPRGPEKMPCYRCMFPDPPDENLVPRCEQAGVFGALAGVVGTLQAIEVLKLLLGLGQSIQGQLLLYDALDTRFRKIKMPVDPNCKTCGPS
ncbi:MAG: molybdopterin-synthase adenylyltransferase MoeB [Alphaproteobacteria bacterium]|nr:molybdopterin-synthase adenylyltransferase MoeB [Alphaproteobacteria bacterium]